MENTARQLSYRLLLNSLVPPSLSTSTEIVLGPWAEDNLSTFLISITMGKSKWKRSRSTNNCTLWGILRSVARALELVGGSRPWDHTSQVSADYKIEIKSDTKLAGRTIFFSQNHTTRTSIQTVFFKSLVVLDNKVTKKNRNDKVSSHFAKRLLLTRPRQEDSRGISFQTLSKRAVTGGLGSEVVLGENVVT
jgi:hypothetical protein